MVEALVNPKKEPPHYMSSWPRNKINGRTGGTSMKIYNFQASIIPLPLSFGVFFLLDKNVGNRMITSLKIYENPHMNLKD